MREALNGRRQADRTRRDYQRVINAYRAVYYGAPASSKADPSVVAVAETMVEMGRRFDDEKILNSAIGQYKFLRKEYPGSKYRIDALFTIGEIYKDDLNDPQQARTVFAEFLHRYPHNRLVDDARQAVVEMDAQAAADKKAEAAAKLKKSGKEVAEKKPAKDAVGKDPTAKDLAARNSGARDSVTKDEPTDDDSDGSVVAPATASANKSGHLPRVTGIRHWSTPDYTRVAIDLESEVKFAAQRINDPDRIFFDLRDTKLASTLVGKSFDVDDGFLKKIRVAQFQPGRTRVVLEVDDLSDYEAFLLPNPYRLIIDIHGKDAPGKLAKGTQGKSVKNATTDVEIPPVAPKSVASKSDADTTEEAKADDPRPADTKSTEARLEDKKDDLKAQAGKAPTTTEDVGDDTKIVPRGTTSKPVSAAKSNSRTTPAPTKVVVGPDDDDDTPVAPARSKTRNSHLASGKKANDLDVHEAKPTASGDRSLIRALGLKIGKIVIDPGHGGHDTGTIGPNGLEEKDLVLEVGRRLGKMLETRLGAEVVYTRKDDTFIPLETRTAIANQQRADLFISIHANSSRDSGARGVETYYLNFTSSPEALEVAARENAVSEKSIYELQDLVKKIAMKEKIEESREFAGDVQQSLHSGLASKSPAIRNRGVKKAPFIVLIGANMPSILAEISFVSNPTDERRLETGEYRQRIADSLYQGIAKYVNGLSGVKVASKVDHTAGQ